MNLSQYYYNPSGACRPATASAPVTVVSGSCKKFRVYQPLNAGANTIVHSLNLAAPFVTIVQLRDPTTGAEIPVRVVGETANTVNIIVPTARAIACITVI